MGYLLTGGVAVFQVAILITIIGAAAKGRNSLYVATFAWVLFTLFGSIFTAGLLLLQLLTILIAYNVGSRMARAESATNSVQKQADTPTSPVPPQRQESFAWIIVGALGMAVFFYFKSTDRPAPPPPTVSQVPQQTNDPNKLPQTTRADRPGTTKSSISASENKSASDLRHCLDLATDAARVRCANQGR